MLHQTIDVTLYCTLSGWIYAFLQQHTVTSNTGAYDATMHKYESSCSLFKCRMPIRLDGQSGVEKKRHTICHKDMIHACVDDAFTKEGPTLAQR
jgi:hypothetical protein